MSTVLRWRARHRDAPPGQRGFVLFVVSILLLLLSHAILQSMDSSLLGARTAAVRVGREESYQAAETLLALAAADPALLAGAWAGHVGGDSSPLVVQDYPLPEPLQGSLAVAVRAGAPVMGNDLVIGRAGLQQLHFEMRATAVHRDGQFESRHRQGLALLAARAP